MSELRMETNWRKVVRDDPREGKLFEALEDPRWDWRTVEALQGTCGMTTDELRQSIAKYPILIMESRSRDGKPIFTLRARYHTRKGPFVQLLDFLSNQSTSTWL